MRPIVRRASSLLALLAAGVLGCQLGAEPELARRSIAIDKETTKTLTRASTGPRAEGAAPSEAAITARLSSGEAPADGGAVCVTPDGAGYEAESC